MYWHCKELDLLYEKMIVSGGTLMLLCIFNITISTSNLLANYMLYHVMPLFNKAIIEIVRYDKFIPVCARQVHQYN